MEDEINMDEDTSLRLEEESNSSYIKDGKMENLKISIDNSEPDPAIAIVKLENAIQPAVDVPDVEVKLSTSGFAFRENGVMRYENAAGDFETGMDLTNEDARIKRKERAKRFGIDEECDSHPDLDLTKLYDSLGITEEKLKATDSSSLRLNVIMMRGVNDLNTKAIFRYFCQYPPKHLEWIDDASCNVVFADVDTCNRAMMNLSRPILLSNKPKSSPETIAPSINEEDETIDLLDSEEKVESENNKMDFESDKEDGSVKLDDESVPPGKWRIANSHPNTKLNIFFRFATKADVKVEGANRQSEYYKKNGNPHYGGLTGIISKSRKQRFWRERQKQLEEEAHNFVSGGRSKVAYGDDLFGETYNEESTDTAGLKGSAEPDILKYRKRKLDKSDDDDEEFEELLGRKKKPALMSRMAADDEEERIARIKERGQQLIDVLDVRSELDRRKRDKAQLIDSIKYTDTVTATLKRDIPDLRSRLSRTNYD